MNGRAARLARFSFCLVVDYRPVLLDKYILDASGNPVLEPDLMKWCEWYESSGPARRVAVDRFGRVRISTVFLALDHGAGTPLLYETMIFGGVLAQKQWR